MLLLFQQETIDLNFDIGSSSQSINEVEINVERAIERSIVEFLNNGFSDLENGEVWYCNMQYPADYKKEVYGSLHRYLTTNINSVVSVLEENGYDVSRPEVIILNNDTSYIDLKNQSLRIELKNFFVTSKGSNIEIIEDLNKIYEINWPVLELYSVFYNWTGHDAGNMEQIFRQELFEEKGCQAILSNCNCKAGDLINQDLKDQILIDSSDIYRVMSDSVVRNLELQFDTESIDCSVEFDYLKVDNEEYSAYVESESSIYSNKPTVLAKNKSKYTYRYGELPIQYAYPDSSELNNYGCPIDSTQALSKGSTYPGVVRDPASTISMIPLPEVVFNEREIDNYREINFSFYELNYMGESCQDNLVNPIPTEKSQLYAASKSFAFLATIKCEDRSVKLESGDYLYAEIKTRLALGESCQLPYKENLNTESRMAICLETGGGGGSGSGQSCSTSNPCTPCEECKNQNNFGIGICVPLPPGTPTNVTCEVCDGNGSTMPAPAQTQCEGLCSACDGLNVGLNACIPATKDNGLYNASNPLTCNGALPCAVCDENATCAGVAPPEFYTENIVDSSICGVCESCGVLFSGMPGCVPNLEDNGEFVPGAECQVCNNGTVVPAPTGSIDVEDCGTCEVCTAGGTCGYEAGFSESITGVCPVCQSCGGSYGSGAQCLSDPSKNGNACGTAFNRRNRCSTCQDGVCAGEPTKVGTTCWTRDGCHLECGSSGYCNVISNLDAFCSKIFQPPKGLECLIGPEPGVCNAGGFCVRQLTPSMPSGKKCCGTKLCDATEDCCDLGSEWVCGACEDETT